MARKRLTPLNPDAIQADYNTVFQEITKYQTPTKSKLKNGESWKWGDMIIDNQTKFRSEMNHAHILLTAQKYGLDYVQETKPLRQHSPHTRITTIVWWDGHIPDKDYGKGDLVNEVAHMLNKFLVIEWEMDEWVRQKNKHTNSPKKKTIRYSTKSDLAIKSVRNGYELWYNSPVHLHNGYLIINFDRIKEERDPTKFAESPYDCIEPLCRPRGMNAQVACDWIEERGYKWGFGWKKWEYNSDRFTKGKVRPTTILHEDVEDGESNALTTADIAEPGGTTYFPATSVIETDVPDPMMKAAIWIFVPVQKKGKR